MKKSLAIIIITLLIIGAISSLVKNDTFKKEVKKVISVPAQPIQVSDGYKNATYTIDGDLITLKDGLAETEVTPGSASKINTRYFGNEVRLDLDGDGTQDIVFLLTQESSGTGIFYYAVAALNTNNGWLGSRAFFIGDRIAPQSTGITDDNFIIVNYADRAATDGFATEPTIGRSLKLSFDLQNMEFTEANNVTN